MKRAIFCLRAVVLAGSFAFPGAISAQEQAQHEPQVSSACDARSLPRAARDQWSDWRPETPPPLPLAQAYEGCLTSYRESELGEAQGRVFRLLEIAPDWPPATQLAGVIAFRLRRYGDAIEYFQRFLTHAPEQVAMTRALGHALYSLGRFEEAHAHYERVLARAPQMLEALRGRALAAYRLGRLEGAAKDLAALLQHDPKHAEAQFWRGQVLWDLGQSEAALAALREACALDPYTPANWHLFGQVLLELGREEEALAAEQHFQFLRPLHSRAASLEAQLLYDPRALAVRLELLQVREQMQDRAGASAVLKELLRRAGKDRVVLQVALDCALRWGEALAARDLAITLENMAGEDSAAWLQLARFWQALGERTRHVQAAEHYLRLGGAAHELQSKKE